MDHIAVYQTDAAGFLLYATIANSLPLQPESFNIPYGAYAEMPPAVSAGHVARRVDDAWIIVEDHRTDVLYVAGTADQYQIGTEIEIGVDLVRYDGGGPVPDWLSPAATIDEPEIEVEGEVVEG